MKKIQVQHHWYLKNDLIGILIQKKNNTYFFKISKHILVTIFKGKKKIKLFNLIFALIDKQFLSSYSGKKSILFEKKYN